MKGKLIYTGKLRCGKHGTKTPLGNHVWLKNVYYYTYLTRKPIFRAQLKVRIHLNPNSEVLDFPFLVGKLVVSNLTALILASAFLY